MSDMRIVEVAADLGRDDAARLAALLTSDRPAADIEAEIDDLLLGALQDGETAARSQRRIVCGECKCGDRQVTCEEQVLIVTGKTGEWTSVRVFVKECGGLLTRYYICTKQLRGWLRRWR